MPLDFSNPNAALDRQDDLVGFTACENGTPLRFTVGPIALGELDPTADVRNALTIYDRFRHEIHAVAERVWNAGKRLQLRRTDFGGGAHGGGMTID